MLMNKPNGMKERIDRLLISRIRFRGEMSVYLELDHFGKRTVNFVVNIRESHNVLDKKQTKKSRDVSTKWLSFFISFVEKIVHLAISRFALLDL